MRTIQEKFVFVAFVSALFFSESVLAQTATESMTVPPNPITLPKLKWSGDMRLRTKWVKDGDLEARAREEIRVRAGAKTEIFPELKAEIRIATAKSNRSTNQPLGDDTEPGSRRRFLGLDLAYAEWKALPFATFYVGRYSQIHFRPGESQVLLDDDLALEGAALAAEYEFASSFFVFGSLGSSLLRENYDSFYSEEQTDNVLNFGQLGLSWRGQNIQANAGAGFFNYVSVQGKKFSELAVSGKPYGNSEALTAGEIKNPYLPRQYFAQIKFSSGNMAVTPFIEYVENPETSDPNRAIWTGLALSKGNWDLTTAYAEVEKDAVLGAFTNSDFADGTVDARGWHSALRWKFMKNMNVRLSGFINRKNMSTTNKEYDRAHLDISASF